MRGKRFGVETVTGEVERFGSRHGALREAAYLEKHHLLARVVDRRNEEVIYESSEKRGEFAEEVYPCA